eukprot:scaffold20352_cov28-Tisochrysis_lutea.AAC.6
MEWESQVSSVGATGWLSATARKRIPKWLAPSAGAKSARTRASASPTNLSRISGPLTTYAVRDRRSVFRFWGRQGVMLAYEAGREPWVFRPVRRLACKRSRAPLGAPEAHERRVTVRALLRGASSRSLAGQRARYLGRARCQGAGRRRRRRERRAHAARWRRAEPRGPQPCRRAPRRARRPAAH